MSKSWSTKDVNSLSAHFVKICLSKTLGPFLMNFRYHVTTAASGIISGMHDMDFTKIGHAATRNGGRHYQTAESRLNNCIIMFAKTLYSRRFRD